MRALGPGWLATVALVGGACANEDPPREDMECVQPDLIAHYPGDLPLDPSEPQPLAPECLGYDVLVVLGCPSEEDGSPSECQVSRADLAFRLREAGYADEIITTGGAVHTDAVEAQALHDLLVDKGVPEDSITMEPLAEHTDENLYYSSQIMMEQGWTAALVVSEPDHLLYTAVCDANCCVALGRLLVWNFPLEGEDVPLGHYELAPPAVQVSAAECDHLTTPSKFMCFALPDRRACADDFQL